MAPAVGRAMTEKVIDNEFKTIDLSDLVGVVALKLCQLKRN